MFSLFMVMFGGCYVCVNIEVYDVVFVVVDSLEESYL